MILDLRFKPGTFDLWYKYGQQVHLTDMKQALWLVDGCITLKCVTSTKAKGKVVPGFY
jgi:hypothetical protein